METDVNLSQLTLHCREFEIKVFNACLALFMLCQFSCENLDVSCRFLTYLRNRKVLFDLILYFPAIIFQINRDVSSWVEPVISWDKWVLLKDHNTVTPVGLEPLAPRSRVKHSTTEPLRSLNRKVTQSDKNKLRIGIFYANKTSKYWSISPNLNFKHV